MMVSPKDAFRFYDIDCNGSLSFVEFMSIMGALNITISEQRSLKIFNACDADESGELNYTEFMQAWSMLEKDVVAEAVDGAGLSSTTLILAVVGMLVWLAVLFGFLFCGIAAFSTVST